MLSRLENLNFMNTKSRSWLITGAILSLFLGLLALSSPLLFAFLILRPFSASFQAFVRFLGTFAVASGVISLFLTIFGKDVVSRVLNAIFALVRIGAGLALLSCVRSGLQIITRVFAAYLIIEGIFGIFGAFKIREQKGWIFILLNGIVALVLGLMVAVRWPSGSAWILGLFFGINLLLYGFSQFTRALASGG